jgi:hypothetical protein
MDILDIMNDGRSAPSVRLPDALGLPAAVMSCGGCVCGVGRIWRGRILQLLTRVSEGANGVAAIVATVDTIRQAIA